MSAAPCSCDQKKYKLAKATFFFFFCSKAPNPHPCYAPPPRITAINNTLMSIPIWISLQSTAWKTWEVDFRWERNDRIQIKGSWGWYWSSGGDLRERVDIKGRVPEGLLPLAWTPEWRWLCHIWPGWGQATELWNQTEGESFKLGRLQVGALSPNAVPALTAS